MSNLRSNQGVGYAVSTGEYADWYVVHPITVESFKVEDIIPSSWLMDLKLKKIL